MTYFHPSRVIHKFSTEFGESMDPAKMTLGEMAINNNSQGPFLSIVDDAGVLRSLSFTSDAGIIYATKSETLNVDPTGTPNPIYPLNGDPFALLSQALEWVGMNLRMQGYTLTINIAAGTYVEPNPVLIPEIGGLILIAGADQATTTLSLNGASTTPLATIADNVWFTDLTLLPAQIDSFVDIATGTARFDQVTIGKVDGAEDGGLQVSSPAIARVGDLSIAGRLEVHGTFSLYGTLDINYDQAASDIAIEVRGLFQVDDEAVTPQINLSGISKRVLIIGSGAIPYDATMWLGTPEFVGASDERPYPLKITSAVDPALDVAGNLAVSGSTTTETFTVNSIGNVGDRLQFTIYPDVASLGPGVEGQIAYVGGATNQLHWFNGTSWQGMRS